MNRKNEVSQPWEELYREVLFEVEADKLPRRIEMAKHAILDRLEDVNCARTNQKFKEGELAALRRAHRALAVLEDLYSQKPDKAASNG